MTPKAPKNQSVYDIEAAQKPKMLKTMQVPKSQKIYETECPQSQNAYDTLSILNSCVR